MLHRLSLLLLLLCSAMVAPDVLLVHNMKARGIWRGPFVSGDGYLKVYCDNHHFGTTEVKNITRYPEWEEHFMYVNASPGSRLKLKVYSKDIENNNHLGTCIRSIRTGNYQHICNLYPGGQLKFYYILH